MSKPVDTVVRSARATGMPRRYLGQLCKHFQHKLPVTLEEIARPHRRSRPASASSRAGGCRGTDDARRCRRRAALATLEDVVARHLKRFAFREEPEVMDARGRAIALNLMVPGPVCEAGNRRSPCSFRPPAPQIDA